MSASRVFSGKSAEPTVIDPVPAGKLAAPEAGADTLPDPAVLEPAPAPAGGQPLELLALLPDGAGVLPPELPLLPHAVTARIRPLSVAPNMSVRFISLSLWPFGNRRGHPRVCDGHAWAIATSAGVAAICLREKRPETPGDTVTRCTPISTRSATTARRATKIAPDTIFG